MQRKTSTIPKAAVVRILMNVGAKRVADSAASALAGIAKEKGLEIASRAVEISKHAGRKTVHEGDVKLAAKK